jgi:undecaprenyl-diphosphatase
MDMRLKKRTIFIWILIAFAVIASFYLDSSLVKSVSFIRNNAFDNIFLVITYLSSEVIVFVIVTALFLWKDKKRGWILPLWLTLGISAVVGFLLKVTIQRPRPFQTGIASLLSVLQEASYNAWNFSFPSSHAMLAFCVVPILAEQYPKLKRVWIAIAVIIAFSRIYLGLHFFSDVIAGGVIGYLIGMMIVKLEKEHKFGKNFYENISREIKKNRIRGR